MAWLLELGVKAPDTKGFIKAIKSAGKSLKNLDKQSKEADNAVDKLSISFKKVGVGVGLAVTSIKVLNKILDSVTGAYAEFENRLTAVGRISGSTAEEMGELEDAFRELATQTGISTAAIAGFAEQGARFGISGVDELTDFTESMVLLGTVTGDLSNSMVKDLARIRELTDSTGVSFGNMSNTIVALGNNFATSESQISRTTARISTDLAQFDIGTDFALGLGTALDSMGISAERGGSAMQRLSSALRDVEVDGGPAIGSLALQAGLTQEAFSALVRENPANAILELAKAGADSSKVLDTLGINSIRTTAVFSTLSSGSEQLSKSMDLAAESISNTNTLMEQSAIQAKTLQNLQKRLAESQEQLKSAFGEEIADSTKEYLSSLLQVLEVFNGTEKTVKGNLEATKLLGEESRKWAGILADMAALTLPALKQGFDLLTFPVAAVSKGLEEVGEVVFGPAIEGLTQLLGVSAQETIELETQIEQQTFLDRLAVKRGQDARKRLKAEKANTAEARAQAKLALELNAINAKQGENYEKNAKILDKGAEKLAEMREGLSSELEIAKLDGLESQMTKIGITLKSDLKEAAEVFNKTFKAAEDIGSASKDLNKIKSDYEAIQTTLKAIAQEETDDIVEAAREDQADAVEDLEKAEEKLRKIEEKPLTSEAPTAAITDQASAVAFAASIDAQNKADTKKNQDRKKAEELARRQRDDAVEAMNTVNESVNNLAKGTYSG